MNNAAERTSSESLSTENNDRARINTYSTTSKFTVGDKVKVVNSDGTRNGPYYIASIVSTGVYTLSHANGQEAEDGDEIEEGDLEAA